MYCPSCHYHDSIVKNSRNASNGLSIRRRRECLRCNSRFSTVERIQLKAITIIKKSGSKKLLERSKIIASITMATRKRNIDLDQIEQIADSIIRNLEDNNINEVHSCVIGDAILSKLLEIDYVSYVRFASVYKDFDSVDKFITFIKQNKLCS